jgi:hypothetical protein
MGGNIRGVAASFGHSIALGTYIIPERTSDLGEAGSCGHGTEFGLGGVY